MTDTNDYLLSPKAHLDGIELPASFELPSMKLVRMDAGHLPSLKKSGPGSIRLVKGNAMTTATGPLAYNASLPHLFKWSYFVRTQDVPDDLLEVCIWALGMYIRIWEEVSPDDLRIIGHLLPSNNYEIAKSLTFGNARWKASLHLMSLKVNRPKDALPYLRAMVEAENSRTHRPWVQNPALFAKYGEALLRANSDNQVAKKVLEQVLSSTTNLPLDLIVRSRVFLARALRKLDEKAAAIDHETWVIKWFRKNPDLMFEVEARSLLVPEGQTTSLILEGLGGPGWLENRKRTLKTDHNVTKQCRQCLARSSHKKLFQCARCRHIYYCSRECQKKDWPHHKAGCKDMENTLKKIAQMTLTNPKGASLAADWKEWRDDDSISWTLMHALGLHRDPTRGKTHIVIKKVEYTPEVSKNIRHKFRVAECGIFRMSDVFSEIERMMNLNRGEGKEYIQDLLDGLGREDDKTWVPIIDLSFGSGVETWLGSTCTTVETLRNLPYNPEWRKTMNLGDPPRILKFKKASIEDQEHIF